MVTCPDAVIPIINPTGEVRGSLIWDASTDTAHWVKTGDVLTAYTHPYTVTLYSRTGSSTDPGWEDTQRPSARRRRQRGGRRQLRDQLHGRSVHFGAGGQPARLRPRAGATREHRHARDRLGGWSAHSRQRDDGRDQSRLPLGVQPGVAEHHGGKHPEHARRLVGRDAHSVSRRVVGKRLGPYRVERRTRRGCADGVGSDHGAVRGGGVVAVDRRAAQRGGDSRPRRRGDSQGRVLRRRQRRRQPGRI